MQHGGAITVDNVAPKPQADLPMTTAITEMEASSDNSANEDGSKDVVSFNDIMDAADRAADQFEESPVASRISASQSRKRKAPVFSSESSETEYSTSSDSHVSVGDNLDDFSNCASSFYIGRHDVVIIHLSSDEDEDVAVASNEFI
jgi:hypothetical protein